TDDVKPLIDAGDKLGLTSYQQLANGTVFASYNFNGDVVYLENNLPSGVSTDKISNWYPADGVMLGFTDYWLIPKSSQNPVLAHAFLNEWLTDESAIVNLRDEGYQQPLTSL